MISGLFARLTGEPKRGSALFASAVGRARQAHWFRAGDVPDTVEGRFAVLASVLALIIVRLEQGGRPGLHASAALTERFVESMDAELRQMGIGDPALGKQVRRLVGALGTRVERLRAVIEEGGDWTQATLRCIYRDEPPSTAALDHSESALRAEWARIESESVERVAEGRDE